MIMKYVYTDCVCKTKTALCCKNKMKLNPHLKITLIEVLTWKKKWTTSLTGEPGCDRKISNWNKIHKSLQ